MSAEIPTIRSVERQLKQTLVRDTCGPILNFITSQGSTIQSREVLDALGS